MTAYAQELRRCQVVLFLRAVIEARGNQCAAAKAAGVHRNTVWRVLHGAATTWPASRPFPLRRSQ